jgi:hypothetical protein
LEQLEASARSAEVDPEIETTARATLAVAETMLEAAMAKEAALIGRLNAACVEAEVGTGRI